MKVEHKVPWTALRVSWWGMQLAYRGPTRVCRALWGPGWGGGGYGQPYMVLRWYKGSDPNPD